MKKYIAHYGIAITLFFTSIASAMDLPSFANLDPQFVDRLCGKSGDLPILTCLRPSTRDFAVLQAAKIHNENIPLIAIDKCFPSLICDQFVNQNDSLQKNMKNILALASTCAHFNGRSKEFGQMLRIYDNATKNTVLKRLLKEACFLWYEAKCFSHRYQKHKGAFLLLVYGGVEHNTSKDYFYLLECATHQKDIEMISTLFQYGANANLPAGAGKAVFWYAKTTEIAQLFINHGANLNTPIQNLHLLSYCLIDPAYKPELFQLYIDKGANPRMLEWEQKSLFHVLTLCSPDGSDTTLEKVKILLDTIGDMINIADATGKTPLDSFIKSSPYVDQKIMALLKQHGAKTSEELKRIELEKKKENMSVIIEQNNPIACFICFENFDNQNEHIRLPCKNNHSEDVHVECYTDLLKHSTACPLCRAKLQ